MDGKEEEEMKAEHETKKSRKKRLGFWESFYLSLIICLPRLILKPYFAERQVQNFYNIGNKLK